MLGRFEGLLAEDGRHRHGNPLLRWGRLQGGFTTAGRRRAGSATRGDAHGGRRAQNAPYRGHVPAFATPGRGNLGIAEALGHLRQTGGLAGVGIPGKHVLHHGGLDRGKAHPTGIPRAFGIEEIAIGRAGPGQQLATAKLGLATASHPLGDQGALILSHSATNLEEQLVMRIVIHRALDKLDPTAALDEFIDQEHLMDIVAGQAIGSCDHHACNSRQGGSIAEAIKTRTLEGSTAIAVIAVDMLLGDMPVGVRRDVVTQAAELLFDRLLLVLTAR